MATEHPPVVAPSLVDLMSAAGAAGPDALSSLLTPLLSGLLQGAGPGDEAGKTPDDNMRLRRKLARARKVLRHQQAQLHSAVDLLRRVARPFGACPFCWGDQPECRSCDGQGRPGYHQPDLRVLVALLAPVLRRANLTLVPTARATPDGGTSRWSS